MKLPVSNRLRLSRLLPLIGVAALLTACGGGGGGAPTPPAPPPPNQPPTADAGMSQDVAESSTVTLSAAASNDADGTIASFAWQQTGGSQVTLQDAALSVATFTAPIANAVEALTFELTVTDDDGAASTASTTVSVNPNEPPELAVQFPCNGCRFFGDALSVRGSVTAGPDNAFINSIDGVASVTVDGGMGPVAAIVQTDGNWIAQNVPVADTANAISLSVVATDLLGETSNATTDLSFEATLAAVLIAHDPISPGVVYLFDNNQPLERLLGVDNNAATTTLIYEEQSVLLGDFDQVLETIVEADGSRLILSDFSGKISAIDLSSGAASVISDDSTGAGPGITQLLLMALDSDENRAVAYSGDQEALYLVNTVTGDRSVISNNSGTGTGPLFIGPTAIAVDGANDMAFIYDGGDTILSVDLATGDRSVLPSGGETLGVVSSMVFDSARSLIVALEFTTDRVVALNPVNGIRTVVSDEAVGSPLESVHALQLSFDVLGEQYTINDYSPNILSSDTDRLLSVSALTGDRAILFDDALGLGSSINGRTSLDFDTVNRVIYGGSSIDDSVFVVDPTNGNKTIISDATVGTGTDFGSIQDLVFDSVANRLLIADVEAASILSVDIATGNRTVVSGGLIGTGPAFSDPIALVADFPNGVVYVVDQTEETVVSVDLLTGERSILSGIASPGPLYMDARGLALNRDNNTLLVTVNGLGATTEVSLQAIDIGTGDRSSLSSFTLGSGPFLNSLEEVVLLEGSDFAIVSSPDHLYRVQLSTGDRQILASSEVANGAAIINSLGMAYDLDSGVIYSWSINLSAILAIDTVTGDRVVVSK